MAILFLLIFDILFFHLCHLTSTDTTFDDKDGGDDDIDRHDGNEYTWFKSEQSSFKIHEDQRDKIPGDIIE